MDVLQSTMAAAASGILVLLGACSTLEQLPEINNTADMNADGREAFKTLFVEEGEDQDLGVLGVASLLNVDGRLAVCGNAMPIGGLDRTVVTEILRDYEVVIGGETVFRDFSSFARTNSEDALLATPAPCRLSATLWDPAFETAVWEMNLTGSRDYAF